MAIEELLSNPTLLLEEIGKTLLYLQAIGIIILFFLTFQIISYILSRKRYKELKKIRAEIKNLNKKMKNMQPKRRT